MIRNGRCLRRLSTTLLLVCLTTARLAAGQQPEVATTVAFTEGATVDREGNVYFTDIITQRIMKMSADGVLHQSRKQ